MSVLTTVLVVSLAVHVPYVIEGPGSVEPVQELISVPSDHNFPTSDRVNLVTVTVNTEVTMFDKWRADHSSDERVVPAKEVLGDQSPQENDRLNQVLMRQSKDAADSAKHSVAAAVAHPIDENAVAVLPMENFSAEGGHDYLADGMTETLIAGLTKVDGLHVVSRTSSMHFKGHRQPLREIADQLGVKWIIEGSIVKAGERVRITAQLIDAATDRHAWAESYERPLTDLLAMQAEVASAIASAVTAALPGFPRPGQTATAAPGATVRPVRPL